MSNTKRQRKAKNAKRRVPDDQSKAAKTRNKIFRELRCMMHQAVDEQIQCVAEEFEQYCGFRMPDEIRRRIHQELYRPHSYVPTTPSDQHIVTPPETNVTTSQDYASLYPSVLPLQSHTIERSATTPCAVEEYALQPIGTHYMMVLH